MKYGITWEPECRKTLLSFYDGNEVDADEAVRAVEWRLSRDPQLQTVKLLTPDGPVYITWIRPYKHYPAVGLSFKIVKEQFRQNCVIERARRTNVPDGSS